MKTFFVMILLGALSASADSINPFDSWSCYFPRQANSGLIKGTTVNVDYNMRTMKGNARLLADCPQCHIMPLDIPIERSAQQGWNIYKNDQKNFLLKISWVTIPVPGAGHTAFFGKESGTCKPVKKIK